VVFTVAAILGVLAALASLLRGGRYTHPGTVDGQPLDVHNGQQEKAR
jgi:hypothetical protein